MRLQRFQVVDQEPTQDLRGERPGLSRSVDPLLPLIGVRDNVSEFQEKMTTFFIDCASAVRRQRCRRGLGRAFLLSTGRTAPHEGGLAQESRTNRGELPKSRLLRSLRRSF